MILLKTQISIFIGVMRICLKSSKENQMINSGREWDWMDKLDPDDDNESAYIDGVDERPSPKEKEYNDDEYDY
jgi:hypothetical protein